MAPLPALEVKYNIRDKLVDVLVAISSDAGSIPAASTILIPAKAIGIIAWNPGFLESVGAIVKDWARIDLRWLI